MNGFRGLVLPGLTTLCLLGPAFGQGKPAADKAAVAVVTSEAPVRLVLATGDATATPTRVGCPGFVHTGGGNILVSQPAPNVIHVTMIGAALAKGHLCKGSMGSWNINLSQCFDVVFAEGVKSAKLTLEGRLIGVLRSAHCSKLGSTSAEVGNVNAAVTVGPEEVVAIHLPPRAVSCGESQELYEREGPICVPVLPGTYTLHQTFDLSAAVHKSPFMVKGTAAEFAPEPAYNPALYGVFDPFIGTATRDFGFRVTIRVSAD